MNDETPAYPSASDLVPGTYSAAQQWAKIDLAEKLEAVDVEPNPELARLYICVDLALQSAVQVAILSRSEKPLDPAAFIDAFLNLEASLEELKDLPGLPGILNQWPKNPGYAIAHYAGWSVMEACWRFAEGMHGAAIFARANHRIPSNGQPYVGQKVIGECGPDIVAWCRMAMQEINGQVMPRDYIWPTIGAIRQDTVGLPYKIRDEYDRADKRSEHEELSDDLPDQRDATPPKDGKNDPKVQESPRPDGPQPPSSFWAGGKVYRMRPRLCSLLKMAYEMHDNTPMPVDEASDKAWGHDTMQGHNISKRASEVNNWFAITRGLESFCPFTLRTEGRYLIKESFLKNS